MSIATPPAPACAIWCSGPILAAVQAARLGCERASREASAHVAAVEGGRLSIETGGAAAVKALSARQRNAAIARALLALEERAARREEAAVAEAWLVLEVLRSHEALASKRDAAVAEQRARRDVREEKLGAVQALLDGGRYRDEERLKLLAEATVAADAEAAAAATAVRCDELLGRRGGGVCGRPRSEWGERRRRGGGGGEGGGGGRGQGVCAAQQPAALSRISERLVMPSPPSASLRGSGCRWSAAR